MEKDLVLSRFMQRLELGMTDLNAATFILFKICIEMGKKCLPSRGHCDQIKIAKCL